MSSQAIEALPVSAPMTYRQLIHQDDQIIKNYAVHYNISGDMTRGQMLEAIYCAHPGPEPLPVLASTSKPFAAPQAGEPLPAVSSAQIAQIARGQNAPNTPPGQDVVRFRTPSDTYSPRPSPPCSPGGEYLSNVSSPPPAPKPRMEFVFPPIPRAHKRPHDEIDVGPRAFSPGPCWLEKMLHDLEKGRKEVVNDLEEAKREVREALEDVKRADVALKSEAKEMKDLLDWLRDVIGKEMVTDIIEEAGRRAEGGASDEEGADGGDSDNDDSGGDEHGQRGSAGSKSPTSSRSRSISSSKSTPGPRNVVSGRTPPHQDSHEVDADNDGSSDKSRRARSTAGGAPPEVGIDEETNDPPQTFGLTFSMVFGSNALTTTEIHRHIAEHIKAQRDGTEPPAAKRVRYSHEPLPGPSEPAASPSRKRGRGEDQPDNRGDGSELEVERSVRYSEGEESDGGGRVAKRRRSDGGYDDLSDSSADGDSPSSSHISSPPPRQFRPQFSGFFGSDAEDSSSNSSDDDDGDSEGLPKVTILTYDAPDSEDDMDDDDFDQLDLVDEEPDVYEFDVDDDEVDYDDEREVAMRLYYTREGPGRGSWTRERTQPIPQSYYGVPYSSSLPPSSQPQPSEPAFDSGAAPSLGLAAESSFEAPSPEPSPAPSAGISQPAVAGPSSQPIPGPSSQPVAGPSNPARHPRPLARARERLRLTATGELEAYIYDTGSEYEERERREEAQMREWRRIRRQVDYPFNVEFLEMRAPPENLLSFANAPAEEEESQVPRAAGKKSKKGKGKKKGL
ncbi:hypothetical protein Hypma_011014 [Hypsizygus marmoreus]|uniref:Uncharacterized protein n=1 Tax=Hypsizygus marmoreus TaxID=39966 RepID=A0A369JMM8_HYPMA|nr:hypothetical protein Hypma_011014 [Hypsizygus marmoreus]